VIWRPRTSPRFSPTSRFAEVRYPPSAKVNGTRSLVILLVMPERYHAGVQGPYIKDRFVYDAATDSYICPLGQSLPFRALRRNNGKVSGPFRVYRASRTVCRTCSAYGDCTKDAHSGRALWIGPTDALLRKHRQWISTDVAKRWYARRKEA